MNGTVDGGTGFVNSRLIRLISLYGGIAGRLAQLPSDSGLQQTHRLQIRRHECREQLRHDGESEPLVGGKSSHLVLPEAQPFAGTPDFQPYLSFHRFGEGSQKRIVQFDSQFAQRQFAAVFQLFNMDGFRLEKARIRRKFTVDTDEIAPEIVLQLQFGNHRKRILLQRKVENRQKCQFNRKIGFRRRQRTLHSPHSR